MTDPRRTLFEDAPASDGGGEEDADLWARVMAGVTPMAPRHQRRARPIEDPGLPPAAPAVRPRRRWLPAAWPPPPETPKPAAKPLPPFAGIDKRTADRFRGGEMAIEGRIDLHGHTYDRAHEALDRFIARAHADGKRCLLVITGKGGRRDPADGFMNSGEGGLRALVPRWLGEGGNRGRVLSIAQATARHGGAGAYYVLLKRVRAP